MEGLAGEMTITGSFRLALAVCALLLALTGYGGADDRHAPLAAGPTAQPVETETAPVPARFSDQNRGQVVFEAGKSELDQYEGMPVDITGQVFNVEDAPTQVGLQTWVDPTQAAGNTVVVYPKAGNPAAKIGDQVRVEGVVDGVLLRHNDEGQALRLPRVKASRITVLREAVAAARATPTAASAASSHAGPVYVVTGTPASGLNVRDAARLTANRKGSLQNGDMVLLVRQAPVGWDEIRGADFTGFVTSQYLVGPKRVPSPALARLQP